ncbi:SDR family oxidoreductase [Paenibacillus rhizophilus]|uniref:SDR family oxidoreductase n=1 Tax=Paenibacillus rhizophilus TaxID=1850366 RepID=A0A3N9PD94_9BACL|nr:SDR family oxidoreductase [Paenibacillus rhizophilus]RQW13480.1 SDR family oxidoreductase [Paenibacillus rhizophilus]
MSEQTLSKTILITGANKGIGFETARRLGSQGFTILVGARNKERGIEAKAKLQSEGVTAHFIELDATSQLSIDSAAKEIGGTFGRLDVLINNVGVALGNLEDILVPSRTDVKVLRETFETNFFGMFAITKALLPLIRKSAAGRIVNLSSGLGSLTLHSDPVFEFYDNKILLYNTSKTAVNALTVHFAHELKDTPVKVNSADPGFTTTDLNGFQGKRTVEQAAEIVVRLATLSDDGPTGGFFDENGVLPW